MSREPNRLSLAWSNIFGRVDGNPDSSNVLEEHGVGVCGRTEVVVIFKLHGLCAKGVITVRTHAVFGCAEGTKVPKNRSDCSHPMPGVSVHVSEGGHG